MLCYFHLIQVAAALRSQNTPVSNLKMQVFDWLVLKLTSFPTSQMLALSLGLRTSSHFTRFFIKRFLLTQWMKENTYLYQADKTWLLVTWKYKWWHIYMTDFLMNWSNNSISMRRIQNVESKKKCDFTTCEKGVLVCLKFFVQVLQMFLCWSVWQVTEFLKEQLLPNSLCYIFCCLTVKVESKLPFLVNTASKRFLQCNLLRVSTIGETVICCLFRGMWKEISVCKQTFVEVWVMEVLL